MAADGAPRLGKRYKGDQFPAVKTPQMVSEQAAIQASYNSPNAIPLEAYFARRGITDPGAKAGRAAYTSVRYATLESWDDIFRRF